MFDLEQAINGRRSTHKPVPRELVGEALELATRAPSNSNVQPWHLVLVSGPARDRLVAALLDVAGSKPSRVPPLPEAFEHYRLDVGAEVYGSMGIARDDVEGRRIAKLRNWEFFRRAAGRDRLHASRPPPRRQPRRWHVPCRHWSWPSPHADWAPASTWRSRATRRSCTNS
jgi:nitroreductase